MSKAEAERIWKTFSAWIDAGAPSEPVSSGRYDWDWIVGCPCDPASSEPDDWREGFDEKLVRGTGLSGDLSNWVVQDSLRILADRVQRLEQGR